MSVLELGFLIVVGASKSVVSPSDKTPLGSFLEVECPCADGTFDKLSALDDKFSISPDISLTVFCVK